MKKTSVNNIGFSIFRPILRLFIFIVANPKIIHRERIPKKEAYLLAGTHRSTLDPLVIGTVTIRPIHYLAKKELMDIPVLGAILKFMGVVRVDRSTKNPEAKKEAINVLNNGSIICVFPEGTINRTKDEPIIPFKYGAVSMAYKSKKPILPFAITGRPRVFNYHIKIIIGDPFYVESDDFEKENKKFEKIVIDLVKEGKKYEKRRK